MKKVKVKYHNRINKKTGKISHIGEYERSKRIEKIRRFIKDNIGKDLEKRDLIYFVVKDLGIKDVEKIKKISNLFLTILSNRNEKVYNKEKISKKTDFNYYFGNGDIIDDLIYRQKKLDIGDTFYNQKINDDKNWKETLKRNNLKIIQLTKVIEESPNSERGTKFEVSIMVPIKNGKGLKIEKKKMFAKEIFALLKKGE